MLPLHQISQPLYVYVKTMKINEILQFSDMKYVRSAPFWEGYASVYGFVIDIYIV